MIDPWWYAQLTDEEWVLRALGVRRYGVIMSRCGTYFVVEGAPGSGFMTVTRAVIRVDDNFGPFRINEPPSVEIGQKIPWEESSPVSTLDGFFKRQYQR